MHLPLPMDVLVPLGVGALVVIVGIVVLTRGLRSRPEDTGATGPTSASDWTGESVNGPTAAPATSGPVTVAEAVAVREADTAPLPVSTPPPAPAEDRRRSLAEQYPELLSGSRDAGRPGEPGRAAPSGPDGDDATRPPVAGAAEGPAEVARTARPRAAAVPGSSGISQRLDAVPAPGRADVPDAGPAPSSGPAAPSASAPPPPTPASLPTGPSASAPPASGSARPAVPSASAPTAPDVPAAPAEPTVTPSAAPASSTPSVPAPTAFGPPVPAPRLAANFGSAPSCWTPTGPVAPTGPAAPNEVVGPAGSGLSNGAAPPTGAAAPAATTGPAAATGRAEPARPARPAAPARRPDPTGQADPAGLLDPAGRGTERPGPESASSEGGPAPDRQAGSARPVAAAVAHALAARAAVTDPARGDARDRLLAVLLDDPVRAVGATVDLADCQEQLTTLTGAVREGRAKLSRALGRLAAAGLRPEQLARLSGLSDGEVRDYLAQGPGVDGVNRRSG